MVDSRSLFYPVPRFNPSPTVSNFIDLAGIISVKISTAEFGINILWETASSRKLRSTNRGSDQRCVRVPIPLKEIIPVLQRREQARPRENILRQIAVKVPMHFYL